MLIEADEMGDPVTSDGITAAWIEQATDDAPPLVAA